MKLLIQRQQGDVADGDRGGDGQTGGSGGGFLRLEAGLGRIRGAAVGSPEIDIVAGGQAAFVQRTVDWLASSG